LDKAIRIETPLGRASGWFSGHFHVLRLERRDGIDQAGSPSTLRDSLEDRARVCQPTSASLRSLAATTD